MRTLINNEKETHQSDIETQMETIRKDSRSCSFGNIQLLLLFDLFCCREKESVISFVHDHQHFSHGKCFIKCHFWFSAKICNRLKMSTKIKTLQYNSNLN